LHRRAAPSLVVSAEMPTACCRMVTNGRDEFWIAYFIIVSELASR
jgi:hypothetical protein